MGIKESMALMPVCNGVSTEALAMIGGASRSKGKVSFVITWPFLSRGCPKGLITRPNNSFPTGISNTRCVRVTRSPAFKESAFVKKITPAVLRFKV